jgi:hypothetical protein
MIDVDPMNKQEMTLFVAACRLAPWIFWTEQEEFHSMFPPTTTLKQEWAKVRGERRDAYIVAAMNALRPYQPRVLTLSRSEGGAA